MAGKNKLQLWLLTDGAPGHWSQSQGIADALDQESDVEIVRVDLRIKSTFWKRVGRLCLPWVRTPLFWLGKVYHITVPDSSPHLIISSGGNTLLANALLAKHFKVPNTYSGTLKGYDPRAYRVVFTVTDGASQNHHRLPLPPVPAVISSVPPLDLAAEPLLAVLVGGNGAGYCYEAEDWQAMAEWLRALASARGARLLLTTSRRTGLEAERILQAALPADTLADAVWWSEQPRPMVRDFLSRAATVVVTEDSLTMVAESIYSRRAVFTLAPALSSPNANDAHALEAYAAAELIRRVSLASAEAPQAVASYSPPRLPDVPALIRAALQPWLPGVRS